ncbi:MAG: D-alanyl-D-alanine carboxypeptidase/D-alanyl-D-alanine-endopeptidase, partial [Crocosphaera sp.]
MNMNIFYICFKYFIKVRLSWVLVLLFILVSWPLKASELTANSQDQSICKADLKAKIDEILNTEELKRSHWGIIVKTLDNKTILYDLNSHKYFIPASNVKLFTTAAVLVKFGSNVQIKTPIYAQGTSPHLSLLKVVGKGDPTLSSEQLEKVAKTLKVQGIKRIDNLVVEDNSLNSQPINLTWEWEDIQFYYATAVNRLILNENAVILTLIPQQIGEKLQLKWSDNIAAQQWKINNQTLTDQENTSYSVSINRDFEEPLLTITGSLAIDSNPDIFGMAVVNPGEYFLNSLKFYLEKEGIEITKSQVDYGENKIDNIDKITEIQSPLLKEIITKANQESNNLYAESLLNLLVDDTSENGAIDHLKENLNKLGLEPNLYHLKDGSGLSRHNLVTPEALANLLVLMMQIPEGNVYRDSLAVGGINGTLETRFKDTIIQGKVQAKTGTLSGTSSLSGYIAPSNYSPLA